MRPDEVPAEAALERAFQRKQMYWHACHGNDTRITFRSEADFRQWFLSEMAEHKQQVRAEMGESLIETFQAMREDGDHDMRTVIAHVRDAMPGDTDGA